MSKTIKKYYRRETIAFAIFACAVIAVAILGISSPPTSAKAKVSTPTISCAGSTESSINITVTAGATGLPAGFSIQWETQADYDQFGWPADSSCPLDANGQPTCGDSFCKGSFSGNASGSRYNLGPGGSVTVRIGDILFDNGASTDCPNALACGTTYVFRAFGHATSSLNRSDFTSNLECETLDCDDQEACTFTQGYWKTHGPAGCVTGNNTNEWPETSLTFGTVSYTDAQLCSIFNKPAAGNGLISLAHQLMAAKLNVANGVSDDCVADSIAAADALIGSQVIPPVGSGSLSPATTSSLTTALDNFNSGSGEEDCPSHCDAETP